MQRLIIENDEFIDPDSYDISVDDVLLDSSGETEAGTKQYDFARKNVHTIDVSYTVTKKCLTKIAGWRAMDKVLIRYLDEYGVLSNETYARITSFKTNILQLHSKHDPVWSVSMTLEEL